VKLDVKCICNAAKPSFSGGSGVDGAIHDAAGKELKNACKDELKKINLGKLATGDAVSTDSFELKNKYKKTIKYIIHTVGPNLNGREEKGVTQKDEQDLKNCYANSLDLAKDKNIHSIDFPAISTFNYKFPTDLAARLSLKAVNEWLNKNNEYKIK
jgi:O-acetyl-ADP-ribose deacetylase (regulator of RNase III)